MPIALSLDGRVRVMGSLVCPCLVDFLHNDDGSRRLSLIVECLSCRSEAFEAWRNGKDKLTFQVA